MAPPDCSHCPAGTEPAVGLEYKWWNTLPTNMETTVLSGINFEYKGMTGKRLLLDLELSTPCTATGAPPTSRFFPIVMSGEKCSPLKLHSLWTYTYILPNLNFRHRNRTGNNVHSLQRSGSGFRLFDQSSTINNTVHIQCCLKGWCYLLTRVSPGCGFVLHPRPLGINPPSPFPGWEVAGDHIYTAVGASDNDFMILTLVVPGFR